MRAVVLLGDDVGLDHAGRSRPGRRLYRGYRDLKPVLGGMGIQVLSTPKGVVSDRRARAEKIGGEVLALIY